VSVTPASVYVYLPADDKRPGELGTGVPRPRRCPVVY
jgi:hypothetical protein